MEEQMRNSADGSWQEQYGSNGYEGNLYEQMERELCRRCHQRKIDRSENPESVLCRECREELIKLKVPPVMAGLGIGVGVLVLLCIAVFAVDIFRFKGGMGSDYGLSSYLEEEEDIFNKAAADEEIAEAAEEKSKKTGRLTRQETEKEDPKCEEYIDLADAGLIITSLDGMLDELEEDSDNLSMAITLADVAMKYSYFDYAAYAIETYLAGRTVSNEAYDRITGYMDRIEVYYNTSDKIEEILDSMNEELAGYGDEAGDEVYMQLISQCHDKTAEYLGNDEYDQALLYYDLAYLCQDEEERIQHLKDCIAVDKNYFDANAQLAVYYRSQGKLDDARAILEEIYQINSEDYSILRAFATLELAEGNLETGLDYAEMAYDMYSEGSYVVDTYLVALKANGLSEEAESLLKEWEDKGYVFDDDFYSFQAGNMTLEEYYIED